ncbi:MAG: Asp-tRNA(Asn)/Glu-tRNA(Gln) amidotransferase subunit GatB, partial [Parcubacteria group bacterium]
MKLQTVIGLEFHAQLKTKTKMFCGCLNNPDAEQPNTNICPICLGHPGVLPVLNQEAVRLALIAANALNFKIAEFSKFDRKNYFYPDLPKGYQISQYDKPLALDGSFVINYAHRDGLAGRLDDESQLKKIRLVRLHMEEDAAKSTHGEDATLIDFNRGGSPLIEIVTAPDFSTPQEAKTFGQELQILLQQLNVSDANMEKGELRCDANISLRPEGDLNFYPKTEIKNINSFRSLERALAYEIERQTLLWKDGKHQETQETRGWDDSRQETVLQRTKESENDYRYFPEPDLPPLTFTKAHIDLIKSALPELPQAKRQRFMSQYEFNGEQTKILTETKALANYTEQVVSELREWLISIESEGTEEEIWSRRKAQLTKLIGNWLINRLLPILADKNVAFEKNKITPENFGEFIVLIFENKMNSATAQLVLKEMAETGADPEHIL